MGHKQRPALSLVEVLVVIGVVSVLVALLVPAVQRVRDASSRARCSNHLKQLGLALHQYHNCQGAFPTGCSFRGDDEPFPHLSWCARILPHLEQSEVWASIQSAFAQEKFFLKSPPHTHLSTVIPTFTCPADARTLVPAKLGTRGVALTAYLGVEGTNQLSHDGMLYLNSAVKVVEVTDGTSNTLIVGERPPSPTLALGWWYAGWGQSKDGSADMVLGVREHNVGSPYGQGCPPGPYTFTAGRVENSCDAFQYWSLHPGGAHFLFADGSARFLSYTADPLMPALATRAGGDVAELP